MKKEMPKVNKQIRSHEIWETRHRRNPITEKECRKYKEERKQDVINGYKGNRSVGGGQRGRKSTLNRGILLYPFIKVISMVARGFINRSEAGSIYLARPPNPLLPNLTLSSLS